MPEYCYKHPKTGETKFIIQRMSEPHVYKEGGAEWIRVFLPLNSSVDTSWNPDSSRDFVEKSGKKRGSLQDIWSKSAELSEKREQKYGQDHLKAKYYKSWSDKRKGKLHPKDPRRPTQTIEI